MTNTLRLENENSCYCYSPHTSISPLLSVCSCLDPWPPSKTALHIRIQMFPLHNDAIPLFYLVRQPLCHRYAPMLARHAVQHNCCTPPSLIWSVQDHYLEVIQGLLENPFVYRIRKEVVENFSVGSCMIELEMLWWRLGTGAVEMHELGHGDWGATA